MAPVLKAKNEEVMQLLHHRLAQETDTECSNAIEWNHWIKPMHKNCDHLGKPFKAMTSQTAFCYIFQVLRGSGYLLISKMSGLRPSDKTLSYSWINRSAKVRNWQMKVRQGKLWTWGLRGQTSTTLSHPYVLKSTGHICNVLPFRSTCDERW